VQAAPAVDLSGVEKSAIYRIAPGQHVESLWSSKEENVYDLLVAGGQLTFSTDGQGRIYRLTPDRQATLLVQTTRARPCACLATTDGVLAATGDMENCTDWEPAGRKRQLRVPRARCLDRSPLGTPHLARRVPAAAT